MNQLFPTAELVDLRGCGESTILKSFPKFVSVTASYNTQIRIVTNGMNTNPAIWEQLMASQAIVTISCDTADYRLFSKIRSGGDLHCLIKNVETIVKYRDKYNVPFDNVYFTCVVSLMNIDKIPDSELWRCRERDDAR